MKAKCYKCGWDWDYKGKSTRYLTCPKCLYKLNVQKVLGKLPNLKGKIPTYLPKPKNPYKKTIEEPRKEFVAPKNHSPVKVPSPTRRKNTPEDKRSPRVKTSGVKEFKNMSDFNLEVHRRKLLEEPKEEFVMAVEVSDPMGKNGKRTVMRKYKETSHLGTVSEIKSNFQITEIPYPLPISNV